MPLKHQTSVEAAEKHVQSGNAAPAVDRKRKVEKKEAMLFVVVDRIQYVGPLQENPEASFLRGPSIEIYRFLFFDLSTGAGARKYPPFGTP